MVTDPTTKVIQQAADDVCQTLLEARNAVNFLKDSHNMYFPQGEGEAETVLRVANMMCILMSTRLQNMRTS